MTTETGPVSPETIREIGPEFFLPHEVGFLQALLDGYHVKETALIAKRIKIKAPESKDIPHRIRARVESLRDAENYSALNYAFIQAYGFGLIRRENIPGPNDELTRDEVKVMSLVIAGYHRRYIAESLHVSEGFVDENKDTVVKKYGQKTIFPVIISMLEEVGKSQARVINA
jgi:DNA-binding NarL/FixJ family response regulator